MNFRPIVLCLVLAAWRLCAAAGYEPASPPTPFDEPWRWTQLEFLNDFSVRDVHEAPDGNLWFSVDDGLVFYDGSTLVAFPFSDTPLTGQMVRSVFTAHDGTLFFLTNQGGATQRNGAWVPLFPSNTPGSQRRRIAQAADGGIWFATGTGLYRYFDGETSLVETTLAGYSSILIDQRNRLWLAGAYSNRVLRLNLAATTGLPTGEPFEIDAGNSPKDSAIELHQGPSGRVWIATFDRQRALLACDGDEVSVVLKNWSKIGLNGYRTIAEGPDGQLWVASHRAVASYRDGEWKTRGVEQSNIPGSQSFLEFLAGDKLIIGGRMDKIFLIEFSNQHWQTYPQLNFQCQDQTGLQWFITADRRIVSVDPTDSIWQSFDANDGAIDTPNALFCDRDGRLWASGSHQSSAAVAWLKDGVWQRREHPEFGITISHLSIMEDQDGFVYFGAGGEMPRLRERIGGLLRYREVEGEMRFRHLKPPQLPHRIVSIAKSDEETFWFGGMSLVRKSSGQKYEVVPEFAGNWIDHLIADQSGTLWLAMWGAGVFRRTDDHWVRFSELDARAGRRFVGLLAGKTLPGIWVATSDGISRYDGRTWSDYSNLFHFQLQREGGQLKESPDGSLWINSATRSWNLNEPPSPSESSIPFRSVRYTPNPTGPDTTIVWHDRSIQEDGNSLFKWTGVDAWSRTHRAGLEYSFRINGGAWSPYQKETETLLTAMPPGRYVLEVRARDHDWNEDPTPATATVEIVPFLWHRPWFILSVSTAVILIITLATLLVRMRVKHLLEIDQFKLNFFTNVSHELRTPLAVIIGPLESLQNQPLGPKAESLIAMTLRNARKMQALVNQLLEFRKLEEGETKYQPIRSDLVLFLKDAVYAQLPLWERKSQQFTLHIPFEEKITCFDPEKLQRIVSNLLSNAIKYTPESGMIDIRISVSSKDQAEPEKLILEISDSGIGIPADQYANIFKPFHRTSLAESKAGGSGIGLAYTLELIKLWGGTIRYQSPTTQIDGNACGTKFTVSLPLHDDTSVPIFEYTAPPPPHEREELEMLEDRPLVPGTEKATILIVEDNPDIRTFLQGELQDRYAILSAYDGRAGLDLAIEHMPDLIITDVMMPELNGTEMSRALKTREETSHIPIIMLTARTSDEAKLKGIESGADDYFPKPVKIALLQARIENLLESRRLLRERFTKRIIIQPSEIAVTPVDEAFLQRALKIVEDSMRDEDFDVDMFSQKMGMSRVTLYRKMKAVTGHPPFQFIREMRLKRAAQLLETGEISVSETLEHIGILDMSYFSKIFRQEYGKSPSEYRNH